MDHWTYPQVIKMLEGGNKQLETFFERHALTKNTFVPQNTTNNNNNNHSDTNNNLTVANLSMMRYKTKAALFYRQQLDHHIQNLLENPKPYRGRKTKVKRRPLGTQTSTI
eukprot:CAMPEP_0178757974 /NCGR_PEP_ID=MMETSP0744-20121128/14106_1 /TAXON_ID=913974 /ORGANISM="Nitzschia punctata, Strain CCMP561" /LENGTH=109 /DNA_ID=CAMNT_0020412243 /DNA_START=11 /DNA_END=340 /DNA_ORIENTATION=+